VAQIGDQLRQEGAGDLGNVIPIDQDAPVLRQPIFQQQGSDYAFATAQTSEQSLHGTSVRQKTHAAQHRLLMAISEKLLEEHLKNKEPLPACENF